jgi:hypothetical protein
MTEDATLFEKREELKRRLTCLGCGRLDEHYLFKTQ